MRKFPPIYAKCHWCYQSQADSIAMLISCELCSLKLLCSFLWLCFSITRIYFD